MRFLAVILIFCALSAFSAPRRVTSPEAKINPKEFYATNSVNLKFDTINKAKRPVPQFQKNSKVEPIFDTRKVNAAEPKLPDIKDKVELDRKQRDLNAGNVREKPEGFAKSPKKFRKRSHFSEGS